jgi:hypothetical protein
MRPDAAKAIEILTRVLEFYDGGRQWIRGYAYREGQRCLISALIWVSGKHDTGYAEDARHYLRAALALFWQGRKVCDVDLIGYNDESGDFEEVRALILEALALARADQQLDITTLSSHAEFALTDPGRAAARTEAVFNRLAPVFGDKGATARSRLGRSTQPRGIQ